MACGDGQPWIQSGRSVDVSHRGPHRVFRKTYTSFLSAGIGPVALAARGAIGCPGEKPPYERDGSIDADHNRRHTASSVGDPYRRASSRHRAGLLQRTSDVFISGTRVYG